MDHQHGDDEDDDDDDDDDAGDDYDGSTSLLLVCYKQCHVPGLVLQTHTAYFECRVLGLGFRAWDLVH